MCFFSVRFNRVSTALAVGVALVLMISPPLAHADADRASFVATYHCALMLHMAALEDPKVSRDSTENRFVILANEDASSEENYTQCIISPDNSEIYCEAASGFYLTAPGQPRTAHLSQSAKTSLARLGFSMDDSNGNFQWRRSTNGKPDLAALADFMLSVLHDVFAARRSSGMTVTSPLTRYKELPFKATDCPLVS
jgi:hypothetical protein